MHKHFTMNKRVIILLVAALLAGVALQAAISHASAADYVGDQDSALADHTGY